MIIQFYIVNAFIDGVYIYSSDMSIFPIYSLAWCCVFSTVM